MEGGHSKTAEVGVRNMAGISFNNRRLHRGTGELAALFLVSIQGINNLREGQTAIDGANKRWDKRSAGCERGISKPVILLGRHTLV